ncbi:hypothetical protein AX16_002630 [Volvariella volvacea WC 439]|nr:hypothetical protein AX16_002630 [Volvariella volvacea WC 439]
MDTSYLFSDEDAAPDSGREDNMLYAPRVAADISSTLVTAEGRDEIPHQSSDTNSHPSIERPSVATNITEPSEFTNDVPVKSTISEFTEPSVPLPRPRPKPRPANRSRKLAVTDESSATPASISSNATPLDDTSAGQITNGTIADRAKTRTRKTTVQGPSSSSAQKPTASHDVIELTSDEDEWDELAIRPSKSKSKSRSKANPRPPSPLLDSAEPSSAAQARQRPKPRPIKRNAARALSPSAQADPSQSSISNGNDLGRPFRFLPTDLPPSDPPPMSTFTDVEHPPIAVLPALETEPPTSSLGSLFSPAKDRSVKGKDRATPHDELRSGGEAPRRGMDLDAGLMPPPPLPSSPQPPLTFFAESSPPLLPSGADSRPPAPDTVGFIITQTPNESLEATAPSKRGAKAKEPKGRKPRKKKALDDDDELQLPPEQDADSPPKKATRKKGKGKGPTKSAQVEVVIQAPPIKSKPQGPKGVDELTMEPETLRSAFLTSLSPAPDSDMEEQYAPESPVKRKSQSDHEEGSPKKKTKGRADTTLATKRSVRGKNRQVVCSDEEDAGENTSKSVAEDAASSRRSPSPLVKAPPISNSRRKQGKKGKSSVTPEKEDPQEPSDVQRLYREGSFKENIDPEPQIPPAVTPSKPSPKPEATRPSISSQYTIAPKGKAVPMMELIKRVNSMPNSPFPASPSARRAPGMGTAYSPYLKSSKSMLSRIAPLHPNRRTPPPPPPPPPPRKKTKKEIEREERWEEELIESVGGITAWACMTDAERKELRKAKWDMEMNGWDD